MLSEEVIHRIHKNELLHSIPEEVLRGISDRIVVEEYQAGESIFNHGDSGSAIFLILQGNVRIHNQGITLAEMTSGNFFGEMALLDKGARSSSASAIGHVQVALLERDHFYEVLGKYPQVLRVLIEVITSRFRLLITKTIENFMSREKELARLVDEKTKDLKLKNEELEKTLLDLNTAQQKLVQSEKLASLGMLTAGIAHEINNPINFVSSSVPSVVRNFEDIRNMFIEIDSLEFENTLKEKIKGIQNKYDLAINITESETLLKGIQDGARRTAEIVKGLQNFSRNDDREKQMADLNDGIDSTLLLLSKKLSEKKIQVQKKFGAIPKFAFYPGQLNQVWMNIISNAIDAMSQGGKLEITTSVNQKVAVVSIKDNGSGMPEEVKLKIFDPFFTTKDVGKGTGLGLSISYGIIEKHQGKLEVHSETGKGTEFVISVPV